MILTASIYEIVLDVYEEKCDSICVNHFDGFDDAGERRKKERREKGKGKLGIARPTSQKSSYSLRR